MSIIIKPIITEKITKEGELFNRFGFVVDKKANKVQIKKAIEAAYGITVVDVNTMNYRADRTTKYTKSGLISGKEPRLSHYCGTQMVKKRISLLKTDCKLVRPLCLVPMLLQKLGTHCH